MEKKRFSVTLSESQANALAELVKLGIYLDTQTAIRDVLRDLFERYEIEPFKSRSNAHKKEGE